MKLTDISIIKKGNKKISITKKISLLKTEIEAGKVYWIEPTIRWALTPRAIRLPAGEYKIRRIDDGEFVLDDGEWGSTYHYNFYPIENIQDLEKIIGGG